MTESALTLMSNNPRCIFSSPKKPKIISPPSSTALDLTSTKFVPFRADKLRTASSTAAAGSSVRATSVHWGRKLSGVQPKRTSSENTTCGETKERLDNSASAQPKAKDLESVGRSDKLLFKLNQSSRKMVTRNTLNTVSDSNWLPLSESEDAPTAEGGINFRPKKKADLQKLPLRSSTKTEINDQETCSGDDHRDITTGTGESSNSLDAVDCGSSRSGHSGVPEGRGSFDTKDISPISRRDPPLPTVSAASRRDVPSENVAPTRSRAAIDSSTSKTHLTSTVWWANGASRQDNSQASSTAISTLTSSLPPRGRKVAAVGLSAKDCHNTAAGPVVPEKHQNGSKDFTSQGEDPLARLYFSKLNPDTSTETEQAALEVLEDRRCSRGGECDSQEEGNRIYEEDMEEVGLTENENSLSDDNYQTETGNKNSRSLEMVARKQLPSNGTTGKIGTNGKVRVATVSMPSGVAFREFDKVKRAEDNKQRKTAMSLSSQSVTCPVADRWVKKSQSENQKDLLKERRNLEGVLDQLRIRVSSLPSRYDHLESACNFTSILAEMIEEETARADLVLSPLRASTNKSNKYKQPDTMAAFERIAGSDPPPFTDRMLSERLADSFQCPTPCYVLALIYLRRVLAKQRSTFLLSRSTYLRLALVVLTVAVKFYSDLYYSTEHHFTQLGFRLNNSCAVLLEICFLVAIDFNLNVSKEELQQAIIQFESRKVLLDRNSIAARSGSPNRRQNATSKDFHFLPREFERFEVCAHTGCTALLPLQVSPKVALEAVCVERSFGFVGREFKHQNITNISLGSPVEFLLGDVHQDVLSSLSRERNARNSSSLSPDCTVLKQLLDAAVNHADRQTDGEFRLESDVECQYKAHVTTAATTLIKLAQDFNNEMLALLNSSQLPQPVENHGLPSRCQPFGYGATNDAERPNDLFVRGRLQNKFRGAAHPLETQGSSEWTSLPNIRRFTRQPKSLPKYLANYGNNVPNHDQSYLYSSINSPSLFDNVNRRRFPDRVETGRTESGRRNARGRVASGFSPGDLRRRGSSDHGESFQIPKDRVSLELFATNKLRECGVKKVQDTADDKSRIISQVISRNSPLVMPGGQKRCGSLTSATAVRVPHWRTASQTRQTLTTTVESTSDFTNHLICGPHFFTQRVLPISRLDMSDNFNSISANNPSSFPSSAHARDTVYSYFPRGATVQASSRTPCHTGLSSNLTAFIATCPIGMGSPSCSPFPNRPGISNINRSLTRPSGTLEAPRSKNVCASQINPLNFVSDHYGGSQPFASSFYPRMEHSSERSNGTSSIPQTLTMHTPMARAASSTTFSYSSQQSNHFNTPPGPAVTYSNISFSGSYAPGNSSHSTTAFPSSASTMSSVSHYFLSPLNSQPSVSSLNSTTGSSLTPSSVYVPNTFPGGPSQLSPNHVCYIPHPKLSAGIIRARQLYVSGGEHSPRAQFMRA